MQIPKSENFRLPFVKKEKAADRTYKFYFNRTKKDFRFLPGQYIKISLPNSSSDNRGVSRYFTISSSPSESDYLMITTKILRSTFKNDLFNLQTDEEVEFFGPLGKFVLDEDSKSPKLFLAGGIGLTPYRSMIKFSSDKKLITPHILIASFKNESQILFREEFEQIQKKNPNFKIIYTVTQENIGKKFLTNEVGRIDMDMIGRNCPYFKSCEIYVCGAFSFVSGIIAMLVNGGVAREKIKKENFIGY